MFFKRTVWSCCETDYLKAHRDESINALSGYLAKSRNAIQNKLLELDGKAPLIKKNKKSFIGKRKDLGNQFFRSNWESNTARWFNHKRIKWIYEPKVFPFLEIKHGTTSLCPDFYLPELDIWVEVKGQLLSQNKAAIRRFKKYYPDEFSKLQYISGSASTKATQFYNSMGMKCMAYYNDLNKSFKNIIPNWEGNA